MADDNRLRFTPWQALKMTLLLPPLALYVLLKAGLMWLWVRRWRPPAAPADDPDRWDVVCLSHVNWRHVWQRNHHTMSHLAKRSKVLYINTIRLDTYTKHTPRHKLRFKRVAANIWQCEMFVLPFEMVSPVFQRLNRFLLEARIKFHMRRLGFGPVVLWYYFPSHRWLTGRLGERAVVYDIQDEYSQFLWAPRDTAERERQLLAEADVVFAGTDALYERKRPMARGGIHFFGCGVDFDLFHNAYNRDKPRDLHTLRNAVQLGYFGAIDERVDSDLLRYMAERRPDWDLVLIGPINPAFRVFAAPNVVFTDQKPYADLPKFLAFWKVCLMPFAISEMTRHINPTKALEYFASGKPVVSTPIPDMVKHYSDVIYFGETREAFVAACEAALADFPAERRERGLALARERSWERVIGEMRRLIDEAIVRRAQREKSGS